MHAAPPPVDDVALVDLLIRLVAEDSQNPGGREAGVVRVISERLAAAGIDPEIDEIEPGRPNLAAAYGEGGGPTLLLNGHTDTMPAGSGWSSHPHQARISAGRLYGLGACDMKAGLAAMVEALIAIKQAAIPLRGRIILEAVIDEEAGGIGTRRAIASGRRADWAIICEPTELEIGHYGNGQVNFRVDFHGVAGHGSSPETGHNAIADAAAFVEAIQRSERKFAANNKPGAIRPSYNIGRIEGGVGASIIPQHCRILLDRRIVPGQSREGAIGDLEQVLAEVAATRPSMMTAEHAVTLAYPPFETPVDSPVSEILKEAVREVTRRPAQLGGLRGTTDAVFLNDAGIQTLVFGPGSIAQAHQPDEFVELEQVLHASQILALTTLRILA